MIIKRDYYPIIIFIIGALILVLAAIPIQKSIKEGYGALAGMESPISKSDFLTMLNESVNNIKIHETLLNTYDPTYNISTIEVDPNANDLTNIKAILAVLKKKDMKIHKLLPTYLPNPDLDGLLDDSLLRPIAQDLKQKSSYAEDPLNCDPAAIQRAIDGYQKMIDETDGTDDDSKNKRSTISSMMLMLQTRLIELRAAMAAPGNTKCLPPMTPADAEKILDGFYMNYIVKIIKAHDMAIQQIQNSVQNNMLNFYSGNFAQ